MAEKDPTLVKAEELYNSACKLSHPAQAAAALVGAQILLFRRLKFTREQVIEAAKSHEIAYLEEFPE